MRNIEIYLFTT